VTLSVLIVDDHDAFREFVARLLMADGLQIVGQAGDGESALETMRATHPNLVLLDVQLPGIDGFDVAKQLAQEPEPPAIVMTSTRDARDYGSRLEHAPVVGFIPKQNISAAAISVLNSGAHAGDHR
jgi:DNA-binding NarL/FixJ family response regulator